VSFLLDTNVLSEVQRPAPSKRVLAWLAIWLEARGLKVDRKSQLVHLSGYEPLYYRSSADMWP